MTVLTLTPSGFLFSRLLAAVETKITMGGNQMPAGTNNYTGTCTGSIQGRPITSRLRVGPTRIGSRREKCKYSRETKKSPKKTVNETGACG